MKLEINIAKKHLYYVLGFAVLILIAAIAIAQSSAPNPGHAADEIGEGTIAGTLTVSGGNVGIGTTSPAYTLEVETAATTSFGLMSGTGVTGLVIEGTAQGLLTFDNQNGEIMQMQLDRDVAFTGGNVGIGTTSPATSLDVQGNIRAHASLETKADNAQTDQKIWQLNTQDGGFYIGTWNDARNAEQLAYQIGRSGYAVTSHNWLINNQYKMVLDSNGNVGIGTTSPSQKLDVAGYVKGTGLCIGTDCRTAWPSGGTGSQWTTSGTNIYYSSGSVGIGTTSPTATLYVQPSSSEDEALQLRPKSGLSGYTLTFLLDDTAAYITHNSALRKLILGANNLNTLIMDASGNVGIGTTSPSSKLDVVTSTGSNVVTIQNAGSGWSSINFKDNAGNLKAFIGYGNSGVNPFGSVAYLGATGDLVIGPGNTERVRFTSAGNVGIGTTSPITTLHVAGSIRAENIIQMQVAGGDQFEWYPRTDGLGLYDRTAGAYDLMILNNGYVGIGTTSPAAKLHVAGVVKATAFNTGDIIFNKDDKPLWRMFEDEEGLYLESLKTGKKYQFILKEVG